MGSTPDVESESVKSEVVVVVIDVLSKGSDEEVCVRGR